MAAGDDAYLLTYRGTQLGDELTLHNIVPEQRNVDVPGLSANSVRDSQGPKVETLRCTVYVHRDNAHTAQQVVEGWHSLQDGASGEVKIQQNLNSPSDVNTFTNAWLIDISPQPDEQPSEARLLTVELRFRVLVVTGTDAYLLVYRGTQLGDELLQYHVKPEAQQTRISRLYGSALAGVHRTTAGKTWRLRCTVLVNKASPHAAQQEIDTWHNLIDNQSGDAVIQRDVNSPGNVETYGEAWLDDITPQPPRDPARAAYREVSLEFQLAKAPDT